MDVMHACTYLVRSRVPHARGHTNTAIRKTPVLNHVVDVSFLFRVAFVCLFILTRRYIPASMHIRMYRTSKYIDSACVYDTILTVQWDTIR